MIGKTLSHYSITAKLGEGGMGEVYLAEDTTLGRQIALKVLPEEMAGDQGRLERFQREAKTIAALSHPNIVTLFSVEEAGDIHFLTMELVEGKTLEDHLPASGFALDSFFDLSIPLADALASAHGKGIVHRDLKPTNVMVTDEGGRVKVLDFGLAKLTEEPGMGGSTQLPTEALTQEGIVVGTPHYMSPEQAKGEPIDHRSDIFSLGVVLFEMATGQRPFQGASSVELLSSVLKDAPPFLTDVKPELPRHLGRIIGRCLEKGPSERYQTARDVYNELKALRKETSSGSKRTVGSDSALRRSEVEVPWVAVLPLKCKSTDPELEDFADGLAEDITTSLSRFSYLMVISRNSVMNLDARSMDARQIGQELGARYLLEGAIRKAGSKIRVNTQLLDAKTGTHLWAESFDRKLGDADIFEIQDEITDRVVATVADPHGVLVRSMATPTATRAPETLTPYEAMLRFFLYQQRVSAEDHLIARVALERAVEIDPEYADAWACLTIVLLDEDRHSFNPRPGALDRALEAAQKAADLDPASSLASFALAHAYYYRKDLGAFRAAADRTISMNPRDGNAMSLMGILFGYAGDWERGVELTTTAMALNPNHPGWYRFTTFFDKYHRGDYAGALAIAQRMNMPDYFASHYALAIAHAQLGNIDAARSAIRDCVRLYPNFPEEIYQGHLEKWMYSQPDLIAHIIEGLEKAGMTISRPDEVVSDPGTSQDQKVASLAVLPFANLSPSAEDEFLSDGVTEEILNTLSEVEGLRVAARSSSFSFKGKPVGATEVGEKLGVDSVLEGSVRRAGDRIRVTSQLVNATDGYQLWSERYDGTMDDIFDVQDQIAASIAKKFQLTTGGRVANRVAQRRTENPQAYENYLRGRRFWYQRTPADLFRAIDCFEAAIDQDPDFAPSYAGIAYCLAIMRVLGVVSYADTQERAWSAARRGVELDPELADAHIGLAYVTMYYGDSWTDCEQHWHRALELDPNSSLAHSQFTLFLASFGRGVEVRDHTATARELDPLESFVPGITGFAMHVLGEEEEAIELAETALELQPGYPLPLLTIGLADSYLGRHGQAIEPLERAVELTHRGPFYVGILGFAYGRAGQYEQAEKLIEELEARQSTEYVTPAALVAIHFAIGDHEGTARWLEACVEDHTPPTTLLCTVGPKLSELGREPRFSNLLDRLQWPDI